ncbi:MAG: LysR substrate-binding domain-containing protein [Paracoccaceae bacterium]
MDISQLRTVLNVAELGSLSRAAERMRIAQPALSRQLRLLEEELGARLFDRHGRGMIPTEAGQEVLRHAQRVMVELEEIRGAVSGADAALHGHVSIGLPPTVADLLSVPLVQAIADRHPESTIRIVSAYSAFLLDWLHRGDIDLAILFEARPSRALMTRPLVEEVLYLIGPPGSDLRADRPVPFRALQDRRLLLPSLGNGLRTIIETCARETGIALDVRIEADSYSTLKDLVRGGHGLTILPLAPIHAEIAAGRLTHAPLADPVPRRRLMLTTPVSRPVSRLARFSAQAVLDTARGLVEQGIWAGRVLEADVQG